MEAIIDQKQKEGGEQGVVPTKGDGGVAPAEEG